MRKKICLLLVIVLCAYGLFFAGAHKGPFTAYAPLTGQVFAVHAETVDAICIQSGMSGVMLEFDSPAEKAEMAQLLNGFTSHVGIPGNGGPGLPFAMGGWSYRIIIRDGNAQASYLIGRSWVKVNGMFFYGKRDYFKDVIAQVNAAEQAETGA